MLGGVHLQHDAFLACMAHAMITEKEEVMGLLLGDVVERDGKKINEIWDIIILRRTCKEKDRVEISPEQLCEAAEEAERRSIAIGKTTRVIGWYHSHPHITVWPSHVDIGTQRNMQMMEENFIGLIFAVFQVSNDQSGRIELVAFQSQASTIQYRFDEFDVITSTNESHIPDGMREVPITIVPPTSSTPNILKRMVKIQKILMEEERDTFVEITKRESHPLKLIYNQAIFEKTICGLTEFGLYPLIKMLETTRDKAIAQLKERKEERDTLREFLRQATEAEKNFYKTS